MRRRTAALVVLVALVIGTATIAGAAATLGVTTQTIDSFTANQAAITTTTAGGDVVAPAPTALDLLDTDANGKVDRVEVTFNETLASYTTGNDPWTLANVPSGGTLASVAVSGSVATLTLDEGAGAADTAVGTMTVALATDADGIRDVAGNQSSFAASAPTDKAVPVPLLVEYQDVVVTNGRLDQLRLTYSEALVAGTLTGTTWSISGAPTGMASADLTGVSASGAQVLLAYSETNGTATVQTTVAPSLLLSHLTNGAAGVRDQATTANLAATFSNRATTDAAAPVLITVTDSDTSGAANGKIEKDDFVDFGFSEPLNATSVPSATTVEVQDLEGAGNDTDVLRMSGILSGSNSLGGIDYLDKNNRLVTFTGTVTLTNSGATIRATLTSACAGHCADLNTSSGAANFAFVSTITGPEGLAVVGGSFTLAFL